MGELIRFPNQASREMPVQQVPRAPQDQRAPRAPEAPPAPPVEPLWRDVAGGVLREERTRAGRTLADVAEQAGISVQYLSEVERGRKEPSSEVLSAVSGALGLGLAELTIRVSRRLSGPVCLAA